MPTTRHTAMRRIVAFTTISLLAVASAKADQIDSAGTDDDVSTPPTTGAMESAPAADPRPAPEFRPPESALAKSDWIKLNSGEWLRGKIERMRDGDLEFDSNELDDLEISFKDIAEFHSPKSNRFAFEGRDVVVGPASMQGDTITIQVDGEPQRFPRKELVAILEGEVRERNFWNFGVGLGASARSGNTDSVDLSGTAYVRRETVRTRWNTSYRGAYATVDGEENTNNHLARTQFDWYVTPRVYLIPLRFDYFKDAFQNIDYRLTPAAGLGYDLYERGSLSWEVLAAFGYQHSNFRAGESEGTFVTVFGTRFETDITKYIEFDFVYTVNLGIPDVKQTTHHAETTLGFDIWGPLDFDVTAVFDRVENPRPDSSGDLPKKNDLRLVVGLSVDL